MSMSSISAIPAVRRPRFQAPITATCALSGRCQQHQQQLVLQQRRQYLGSGCGGCGVQRRRDRRWSSLASASPQGGADFPGGDGAAGVVERLPEETETQVPGVRRGGGGGGVFAVAAARRMAVAAGRRAEESRAKGEEMKEPSSRTHARSPPRPTPGSTASSSARAARGSTRPSTALKLKGAERANSSSAPAKKAEEEGGRTPPPHAQPLAFAVDRDAAAGALHGAGVGAGADTSARFSGGEAGQQALQQQEEEEDEEKEDGGGVGVGAGMDVAEIEMQVGEVGEVAEEGEEEGPIEVQVQIVSTREQARQVVQRLMEAPPSLYHAVDTEVMDIDLKRVGPVGNGRVTCISVYSGPDFDYGEGKGKVLWVDNIGEADGVVEEFAPFLSSETHKKVWHNYGFDRHVLYNAPDKREGQSINCLGFGGDTMHMARLWDSSMEKRAGEGGFSLGALSNLLLGARHRKESMKELFGVGKLKKDGTPGNVLVIPPVFDLQTNPDTRDRWIRYSAYDAQATWLVHQHLQKKLSDMVWRTRGGRKYSMLDFYNQYLVPFGELLTDMERQGIYVETTDYLSHIEVQAKQDRDRYLQVFTDWVKVKCPEADAFNPSSASQIQTLLFGGCKDRRNKEIIPRERAFRVERCAKEVEASQGVQDEWSGMTAVMLKQHCKEKGLKLSGSKQQLLKRLRGEEKPEVGAEFKAMKVGDLRCACLARGLSEEGTKAQLVQRLKDDALFMLGLSAEEQEKEEAPPPKPLSKYRDMYVSSLGLTPFKFTKGGAPAVTMDVLRSLAGKPREEPPVYGPAFEHFQGGEEGKEACLALDALCQMGGIDTMISNFLLPLQELADENSRVHCSLNLNTETGRLSARRPNLQNQPALEKDSYKIRAAFRAEEGKRLIVADYGQLELRLLAHMSKCKSMIKAFEEGGCFHSRTAMGMFPHVKEAVDKGEVLLEWDYSKGEKPDRPLVKDKFASERRRAKTLNFSIAYGKTPHGLSKDWGVSVTEAKEMLDAWIADRPEVAEWQEGAKKWARENRSTRTLMGRYRNLPDITSSNKGVRGHMERATINTPVQGGAADIAMMAMLKLRKSELLEKLGWKLLLQVHDEVILEGPEESVEEAMKEVVHLMENPWCDLGLDKLLVKLTVDADHAKTWYEAK